MDFREKLTGKQKEMFCSVANKLLNECFIMKIKNRNNSDYIFIMENKEIFEEYFDFLGYDIVYDKTNGVIGISNRNGTGRIKLKKIESILLLILRTIYIEKRKSLSLTNDVIIDVGYIYEKYSLFGFKKKTLDKTIIPNALSLFKKFNLVEILGDKNTNDDTRIIIYPSILMAITYNSLDEAYQNAQNKLLDYKNRENLKENENEEADES